jgi:hypothetical protein
VPSSGPLIDSLLAGLSRTTATSAIPTCERTSSAWDGESSYRRETDHRITPLSLTSRTAAIEGNNGNPVSRL